MTATGSIVVPCRQCNGQVRRDSERCWNCAPPPRRHGLNHPGRGFVLEGQRIADFEPGARLRDVYSGESFELVRYEGKRDYWMVRVLSDSWRPERVGQEFQRWDNNGLRYIAEERYWLRETWERPDGKSVREDSLEGLPLFAERVTS